MRRTAIFSTLLTSWLMLGASGCALWSKPKDPLDGPPVDARAGSDSGVRPVSYEDVDGPEKDTRKSNDLGVDVAIRYVTGRSFNPKIAKEQFARAEELFRKAGTLKDKERADTFYQAAGMYMTAAERWPGSAIEEDGLMFAAEAYFFSDNYAYANDQYDAVVKKYPNTRHLDTIDARKFAIAEYWMKHYEAAPSWILTPNFFDKTRTMWDTRGYSIRTFQRIRTIDPTGHLADDATMAAAAAQFKVKNYHEADVLFTDLRDNFPSSEHQFNAHFLGIKAKLLQYKGADYDGTVLDESEKLIKKTFKLFPQEASANREALETAMKQIRTEKARRDWEVAQFYEKRGDNGSARIYYEQLAKNYPDTSVATTAKERIAGLQGKPEKPPERFGWLTETFKSTPDKGPLFKSDAVGPATLKR